MVRTDTIRLHIGVNEGKKQKHIKLPPTHPFSFDEVIANQNRNLKITSSANYLVSRSDHCHCEIVIQFLKPGMKLQYFLISKR